MATELDLLQSDARAFSQLAKADHLEVAGGNLVGKNDVSGVGGMMLLIPRFEGASLQLF